VPHLSTGGANSLRIFLSLGRTNIAVIFSPFNSGPVKIHGTIWLTRENRRKLCVKFSKKNRALNFFMHGMNLFPIGSRSRIENPDAMRDKISHGD
jgi:hypothetical protein